MTKYNVILADPPWQYVDGGILKKDGNGGFTKNKADEHYPLMKDRELIQLPIKSICDNPCVLYMWSTGPVIDRAIKIAESWGFTYRQIAFVWQKDNKVIPGVYTLTSCEFVLVFGLKHGRLPKRSKTNARQFL